MKKHLEKFVFASSAAVYGDGDPLPLREDYSLKPVSPYGASKVSGEYYSETFSECYGLDCVVLRPFNVYGPGQGNSQYAGVITKFVEAALRGEALTVYGDGCQTRDFIYVDDVVKAFVKALEHETSKTEVFNVCTGEPVSINSLAKLVCEVTEKDLNITHVASHGGDILRSCGDPEKAKRVLGFEPGFSLERGICVVVRWFQHRYADLVLGKSRMD